MNKAGLTSQDSWQALRAVTTARIAIGRAGGSIPIQEMLKFKADQALARDAVHHEFQIEQLAKDIGRLHLDVVSVESAATDRFMYLRRPDLGRRLADVSKDRLREIGCTGPWDLAIIVSDGLSAVAAHRNAVPLLEALLPILRSEQWTIAPIVVAGNGRVALEDEIGNLLGCQIALMLIGERPGLGSPDSLGAYLVHTPRVGNTDANRNCVSNIRHGGLVPSEAANVLWHLLSQSRLRKVSGVMLKDDRPLQEFSKLDSMPKPD